MASASMIKYNTPTKRHLTFWDRNNDGFLYFGDSLRGSLALGLDFPVALTAALGLHMMYGNTRPAFFGPFNAVDISRVDSERNMLQAIDLSTVPSRGLDRRDLLLQAAPSNLTERLHVLGLWALSADKHGFITAKDIRGFQAGTQLYDIAARRKDREDVLPLSRGGPISVTGHSWFVYQLFGVKVYRLDSDTSKDE